MIAAPAAECPIAVMRWQEDCRPKPPPPAIRPDGRDEQGIGDRPAENTAPARDVAGWQRLRYLSLQSDARLWMTLGAEYRLRVEGIDRPTYGVTPASGFTAFDQRFLVHTDLRHASGARLFAQLAAASSDGRQALRPFDRSAPDFQQLFVDVPLGGTGLIVRVGRQEFDGDGNRLFAIRDASSLRRAFDMTQLDWRRGGDRIALFYGSPVLNEPGAFDDRRSRGETFGGLIVRHGWASGAARGTVAVVAVERRRPIAVYQDARGGERRRTAMLRVTVDAPNYSGNLTIGAQRGRTGPAAIRAGGGAGEAFWKTRAGEAPIRVGASFGIASGDERSGDGVLETFDPIYPNLGYFTDAPIVFPGNTWDIHPQLIARVRPALELAAGVDLVSRLTARDATYQSGVPRLPPRSGRGNFLGALPTVKVTWTPSQHVAFTAAVVHAVPGGAVTGAGARAVSFGMTQLVLRY